MNATTQTETSRALKHRNLIVAAAAALILSSVAGAGRFYVAGQASETAAVTPAVTSEPASFYGAPARSAELITLEEQILVGVSEPASFYGAPARDPELITLEEQILVGMLGLR